MKLLLAWASAKAGAASYADAAKAYRAYLDQVPVPSRLIRQEAKRVYAQAATQLSQSISPPTNGGNDNERTRLRELRAQVVGLLYKEGGFRDVLKLINEADAGADWTGALSMYHAFALGQDYKAVRYGETSATGWEEAKIPTAALEDIKRAVARGQSKSWIHYIWNKADPSKPYGPDREDDLESFFEIPQFKAYFDT